MALETTQKITVDRISNSGNAIAQQQRAGKAIHVPAGEIGETLEVRLVDKGGYFVARLVDRINDVRPRGPTATPDTSSIGSDLVDSSDESHSYAIRTSPAGGRLRSTTDSDATGSRCRSMSRRKK
jgi:tRNA/tmRNA/rRNA uracil-C5-methylase (TrmA/RlmC/RlmD family)